MLSFPMSPICVRCFSRHMSLTHGAKQPSGTVMTILLAESNAVFQPHC